MGPNEIRKAWTMGKKTSTQLIWELMVDRKINEQMASDIFFEAIAEWPEED